MIVSTDYRYVRVGNWQKEISRNEVFRRFPDKRSWWIDSSGEVFDAENDHYKFIKDHPELFDDTIILTHHAIKKFWVRVSEWGPSFTIQSRDINQVQLDAAQTIYMYEGKGKKVEFFQGDATGISFDKEEFLGLKNVNQLKRLRSRVGSSGDDRAWLISPRGEAYLCGFLHHTCGLNKDLLKAAKKIDPDVDGGDVLSLLMDEGWARVGYFEEPPVAYLDAYSFTGPVFRKFKEMLTSFNMPDNTKVTVEGDEFLWRDFKFFDSMKDAKKFLWHNRVGSSRRGSLPKSRNFLMGIPLESMPWPLRQAFDLLNLSEKKDKLSANQVASVFQANDEFLQDHLGRTSTELIRDLNAYFQYGKPKEQIAQ